MTRIAALFLAFVVICSAAPELKAQADAAADVSKYTQADLLRRLQDVEKEVATLRAQLDARKQAAAAPPSAQLLAAAPAPAAPFLGGASLTGFVDAYYGYNFNQPQSRTSSLRAFDGPSNQFALNLIELNLDKPPDPSNSRLGYHLGLGFGQAMNVVNAGDPAGLGFAQYLKEAYISYLAPVGKGLQVDIGKFVTPYGAEVIETKDDWNYSRGLLFAYAVPFYHYGARAHYSFSDKYSLTGILVNGWNSVYDNNTGKSVGLSFAWIPSKKLSITQGYMAGPETAETKGNWRQLVDTVVTYSPTSRLTTMVNFDYGRGDHIVSLVRPVYWAGIAGFVRYAFNERYALATRYEYYNDHDGFTTGTAQHLHEVTGTFQRVVAHHLITRLEFRRDFSNRPVFLKGNSPVSGQNTMTAGIVYAFDLRETK